MDQISLGIRVLAVDDDPTCLLESLLRRCEYDVITTNLAVTALKLLRENKNKFDLVISEVFMPDMDGFELLDLVVHEMDLPVIMLSASGDRELVMKAVVHGASDYLLKPVRIEQLQNIWEHVVWRRRFDSKNWINFGSQHNKANNINSTGEVVETIKVDLINGKINNIKWIHQNEREKSDENGQCLDLNKPFSETELDLGSFEPSYFFDPLPFKLSEGEKSAMEPSVVQKEGYIVAQARPQGSYISDNIGFLEVVTSAMMKRVRLFISCFCP
ncbi:hypothetical protein PTKIN_Ptkin19aG0125700 [Pterospermum kingtungense]